MASSPRISLGIVSLFGFVPHDLHVSAQSRGRRLTVTLVVGWDLPGAGDLVRSLTCLLRRLDGSRELVVEGRVLLQVSHRHYRAVAGDDLIDVLDALGGLRQRLADLDTAAAIVRIEQRNVLAREDVA